MNLVARAFKHLWEDCGILAVGISEGNRTAMPKRAIAHHSIKRRLASLFAALLIPLSLIGATLTAPALGTETNGQTSITLWVYPIGEFGNPDTVQSFIDSFNQKYPNISVNVDYLDYAHGDNQVSAAIAAGTTPDVVMEGPERIVSNWGAKGEMIDLSDLWTPEVVADISANEPVVQNACKGTDGAYYEYPLCKTPHCMAINYEVFEKAGALQYLDLENRTWTTEGFMKACQAIAASGLVKTPGVVYCGGQGGDQGTRALVSNLYGASFTNPEHTAYTINSAAGVQALTTLTSMVDNGMLSCNASIQASDEISLFTKGSTAMTFAWNSSNAESYGSRLDFTPYAMSFPTDQANPQLCPGIWGFGVFDNKDAAKAEAAKTFIRFLCDDAEQGKKSVRATHSFPVRASFGDVYNETQDSARMQGFRNLLRFVGDYYNITPGWAAQRTAWWNMLQQVFSGTDPQTAANWYASIANGAIDGIKQSPVASIADQKEKHVLFISSYSLSDPAVKDQINGIKLGLGKDVHIHYEFMDSMTVNDETYAASFYDYLTKKYSNITSLGAIIVGNDDALQIAVRYQEGFFKNIPVIYESVSSQTMTELADSLGMVGIPTRNTIQDNLDLARHLYPHATKIVAISDESTVGTALTANLKAVAAKYAPLDVEILDTSVCTADDVAQRIQDAGNDAVLLYLNFTVDSTGKTYPYEEALNLVTAHASTPVFTLNWLGEDSLGGIAVNSTQIGRYAGEAAQCFLNGEAPTGSIDRYEASTLASFNYPTIAHFGLHKIDFPAGSIYYNDIDSTANFIFLIITLVAGLVLLTIALIRYKKENQRRRHNEHKLQRISNELREEADLDVLTGLGNRRLFNQELARSVESGRPFTLFILDLDDFKNINDTYGHLVGDMALRETGQRLLSMKSRAFVPYRYGGDEFALMSFSHQPDTVNEQQKKLLGLFERDICSENHRIRANVSVGCADFPTDACSGDALIECADKALYSAKTSGKHQAKRYREV